MAHIHNGILLSHKRNEIDLFDVKWMALKSVIQSEVRKRKIPYANTYTWNLKKKKKGHEVPRGKMGIKTQTY